MTNKGYQCEKCQHIFTQAWNLKQHQKHSKTCGTSNEQFVCTNCGKNYTLAATLQHHFARCIALDPHRFECKNCNRKFTFKTSLRKHLKSRCPSSKAYLHKVHELDEMNSNSSSDLVLERSMQNDLNNKQSDENNGPTVTID